MEKVAMRFFWTWGAKATETQAKEATEEEIISQMPSSHVATVSSAIDMPGTSTPPNSAARECYNKMVTTPSQLGKGGRYLDEKTLTWGEDTDRAHDLGALDENGESGRSLHRHRALPISSFSPPDSPTTTDPGQQALGHNTPAQLHGGHSPGHGLQGGASHTDNKASSPKWAA
uniref:Uncharacterized protein n=2 Tax=Hemiselmis andersenii TaxID=464988 RepID=A0A6U2D4A5_HEMAN